MRESCEKERARFHSVSLAVGAGGEHERTQTKIKDKFEPDNDQGFLPTRLSVKKKRRGVGFGSGEPGKG